VAAEQLRGKKDVGEQIQLLVFVLDQEEYAVPIVDLREIIRLPDVTPIPNAPDFIKGILNLRGKIVVVVDLEKRFSLVREHKTSPRHIIITEVSGSDFGVMVDEVKEVIQVPVKKIQPTPELVSSKIHADYLKGVIVLGAKGNKPAKAAPQKAPKGSRLLILLDLVKLLQEKELLNLGQAVKRSAKSKK
jgi:purine-binding chemotaxis protein CheW